LVQFIFFFFVRNLSTFLLHISH